MKKLITSITIIAIAASLTSSAIPAFAETSTFSDVPATHWAYNSVQRIADLGYVEGYGDGTYGAEDVITHEQVPIIICRMFDFKPTNKYTEIYTIWNLTDQYSIGHYPISAESYQIAAVNNGIYSFKTASGRSGHNGDYIKMETSIDYDLWGGSVEANNAYYSYEGLSRAETAKYICRLIQYLGKEGTDTTDLSNVITDWDDVLDGYSVKGYEQNEYVPESYKPYVAKVYADGIMTGYPDGSFKPQQIVTRAEFATILTKFIDLYM